MKIYTLVEVEEAVAPASGGRNTRHRYSPNTTIICAVHFFPHLAGTSETRKFYIE
jgi:hypothetical protein